MVVGLFFLAVLTVFIGCAARKPPAMTKVAGAAETPPASKIKNIPAFELPVPQLEPEKNYLGVTGTGKFKLAEIKAPVLLIEIFSFYCPYCQQAAPKVNELYQEIEKRPDLKDKVKLIGIGASNSLFEVNSFREKYHVPFPLFADQNMEIFKLLGARGTPTFVGLKLSDNASQEQFFFGEGAYHDTQKFLDEFIKLAGL